MLWHTTFNASTGELQCEQPNNSLYTFTGNLVIESQTLPLSPNQILLRVSSSLAFPWFFSKILDNVYPLVCLSCSHTYCIFKNHVLVYFDNLLPFYLLLLWTCHFEIFWLNNISSIQSVLICVVFMFCELVVV